MRVLTLTALEDVHTSGPVRTQVLPLLERLAVDGDVRPALASLVPAHRGLRASRHGSAIRDRLARAGVPFRVLTLAARSRVYVGRRTLALVRAQTLPRLRALAKHLVPDLVHARGHVAAHLAAALGVPYVFDCRGHYREEALHVGAWARGSLPDHFWHAEEPRLVRGAARVVAVSDPFRQLLGAGDRLDIIPCFAEPARPEPRPLAAPLERFLEARPTLTYVGSLTSWYAPESLFRAFARIASATAWNVLVVTGEIPRARALAARAGIPQERLHVETLGGAEVAQALARSRATIWAAFGPPTALHATQLGIKFAEYAAAGRPMLISRSLGAAAALVETHGAGVVLDDAETETLRRALARVETEGEAMGRAARALFAARFSLDDALAAYRRVYAAARSARAVPAARR